MAVTKEDLEPNIDDLSLPPSSPPPSCLSLCPQDGAAQAASDGEGLTADQVAKTENTGEDWVCT